MPETVRMCKWGCGRPAAKSRNECKTCNSRLALGWSKEALGRPKDDTKIHVEYSPILQAGRSPILSDSISAFLLKSKKAFSIEELADRFDCAPSKVKDAVHKLRDEGRNIQIEDKIEIPSVLPHGGEPSRIDVSKLTGKKMIFGLLADQHLCSKYSRLDLLNALYDIWERQGVKVVLQGGNMIDGEASFNRFDLLTRPGIESQTEYLINEWPKKLGMETWMVAGDDHEGWYVQREGVNIIKYFQHAADVGGRQDLKFLGYMEHDLILKGKDGSSVLRLIHAGGGSSYAVSYSVQKILESYSAAAKPSVLLVGHFHKASYDYIRDVHVVQAASTQDQSPYLRKKRIQSMLGGWTISFEVNPDGVVCGFATQFHNFFDEKFYDRWSYKFRP